MAFISRPRPAWHRSAREATTQRQRGLLTGTKRGERCHHHFRCWFRESCRGQHSAAEIEHFKQFETQAVQLDLPYCRAGVCHHEGCTHSPQQTQPSMQSVQAADNETFHDALLIPHTRRRHRRLRRHQRIRAREKSKASGCIPTFRRARGRLSPTQNAASQTQLTDETVQRNTHNGTAGETGEGEAESVTLLLQQTHIQNLQDVLAVQRQLNAEQETELNSFHQEKYLKEHRQKTTASDKQWMHIPANQISGLCSMLSEHAAIYPVSSAEDAAKFNKEAPIRICIPTYWLQG